jgi:3D (Asp-Asp-Asp) domain-containing protein
MKKFSFGAFLLLAILFCAATVQAASVDRVLKPGMSGYDVEIVQRLLANAGYYTGTVDGVYGSGTENAIRGFQNDNGLAVDGVAGLETVAYLDRNGVSQTSRGSRALSMVATAYTAYDRGCSGYTANGNRLRRGLVAVDPNVIPLGTRLFIEGYGYAVADDVGSAIKGNHIDLAFESRSSALEFGRQRVTVYIVD